MRFIGNMIWFLLGGWLILLEYLIGGLICCLTVVGIPFGIQIFKLSALAAWPFGKEIVRKNNPSTTLLIIMNIIWILFGGIWTALTHLLFALVFAITIVGLPFAKQHLKLASLAFAPFGRGYRIYRQKTRWACPLDECRYFLMQLNIA